MVHTGLSCRPLSLEETPETAASVDEQVTRLAVGGAATLARDWQMLALRGEAAVMRGARVTYFPNQTPRMAYHQYRSDGWDIGSGMIQRGCKTIIGQQETGASMRWSDSGAQSVAAVRLLLVNTGWDDFWHAD